MCTRRATPVRKEEKSAKGVVGHDMLNTSIPSEQGRQKVKEPYKTENAQGS